MARAVTYPALLDQLTHFQSPILDPQQLVDEFNGQEFGWDLGHGIWGLVVQYVRYGGWAERKNEELREELEFFLQKMKLHGSYSDIPIGGGRGGASKFKTYNANRGQITIQGVELDTVTGQRIYTLDTDVTELEEKMWLEVTYLGHPRLLRVWDRLNSPGNTKIVTRPSLPLAVGAVLSRASRMRCRVLDKSGLGFDFERVDQAKHGVAYEGKEVTFVEFNAFR